ncbi:MAG: DUF222 domain-containing protein [Acidimicrobiales bacterium]
MSLLMDAPPVLGVLEALEALPIELMAGPELGVALRGLRVVQGRVDVVDARLVAAFGRVNGAQGDGATDTTSWLADKTKTSGRAAKRRVKRARVLEVVPGLGDALAAGEISAAHVDAIAAIVPAPLLAKAGSLVAAAKVSTPEELARKAQQLVIDNDGDGGAKRALRLKRVSRCGSSIWIRGCGRCWVSGIPSRPRRSNAPLIWWPVSCGVSSIRRATRAGSTRPA